MPISHPWLARRELGDAANGGGDGQRRSSGPPAWGLGEAGERRGDERYARHETCGPGVVGEASCGDGESRGVFCRARGGMTAGRSEIGEPGRERPPCSPLSDPLPARSEGVAHAPAACLVCPDEVVSLPQCRRRDTLPNPATVRWSRAARRDRRRRIHVFPDGGAMALIKPRTRGKHLVRHRTRLDHETNETLYAYAHTSWASRPSRPQSGDRHGAGEGQGLRPVARGASGSFVPQRRTRREQATCTLLAPMVAIRTPVIPARSASRSSTVVAPCCVNPRSARGGALVVAAGRVGTSGIPRPRRRVSRSSGRRAPVFLVLVYGYAGALVHHAVLRRVNDKVARHHHRLPASADDAVPAVAAYPGPETRSTPMLVLGESHHHTTPGRAPQPSWLTIPQRGLYTGVMVLGAVGTGKTSACMYPYVDQLLRWRSQDERAEDRRPRPGGEG